MTKLWEAVGDFIVSFSNWIWGMPLFLLLIGGGLYFLIYSGFVPFRYYIRALKSLKTNEKDAPGQISSFEALTSAIAATVGMGNISGVAVALTMGGPGAIFWMWVSAVVGMATKFFEGTLTIMYKGRDSAGELQGGPMYMITEGLGKKWKPFAVFFSIFGLIGTLCLMQANQLTEAITTVFTTPAGIENTIVLRLIIGISICLLVSIVVLGGIKRISKVSARVVPAMVAFYFILVAYIVLTNLPAVPGVFASIFGSAFDIQAGAGGLAGTAIIIGARRAAFVNEAGVGTASMMHGASRNSEPVREGLVAMIGPSIDSGLVCTLTALAILINGNYEVTQIRGIEIALNSFQASIPGVGHYLLMIMVLIFAFSTMFSYSYYGVKCTNYLFGAKYAHLYNYFFLLMLIVGAIISLDVVVGVIDSAYALMAIPTMLTLLILSPKVKKEMKKYFAK
ncbi:MAG: sodium/alanine symporter [Bacteroidetes bacterium GWF2_41_61]|nr:MAG: sodium/alanine symporter [Bacteroidetes bacterium GWF2_41_61]OFY88194.1 MAG: sodium/alanine symporter [Bacteroidetes bacterium RIFOXYA12_FULL_40_10]